MRRFILSAAVLVIISGLFAGSAEAASRGGRGGAHAGAGRGGVHGGVHGSFHGGYRSYPYGYRGWSRSWYNPYYRTSFYFDVAANGWFYYYAPQQAYLPASQVAVYPPTVVVNNNVNVPMAPMPADFPALPAPIQAQYSPGR